MEPINWRAMTPEQRNDVMHEKVMGHARKTTTHTSKTRAGDSFSYNVTSWQTGEPETPRYSQSMDAAWQVLQEMVKRKEPETDDSVQFEIFTEQMLAVGGWDNSTVWSEIYPASEVFVMAVKWTPEAICIAALRALGYEVVIDEALTDIANMSQEAGEH